MAITLVTQPDAAAPTDNADYTQQNILINGSINQAAPEAFILTDWISTVSAPIIKQGTYIRHAGNLYVVDTSDYTILGSVVSGINYIRFAVATSTTLSATWTNSYVGYTFNPVYNGWYSGTSQIVFQGVYLNGSDYIRCQGVNNDPDKFRLANGDFRYLSGNVYIESSIEVSNRAFSKLNSAISLSGVTGSHIFGGDGLGGHISVNGNVIQRKNNSSTAGPLNINPLGGSVNIGKTGSLLDVFGSLLVREDSSFNDVTIVGNISLLGNFLPSSSAGSQLLDNSTFLFPAGIFDIISTSGSLPGSVPTLERFINGSWITIYVWSSSETHLENGLPSNGSNLRISVTNTSGSTTVYYNRY